MRTVAECHSMGALIRTSLAALLILGPAPSALASKRTKRRPPIELTSVNAMGYREFRNRRDGSTLVEVPPGVLLESRKPRSVADLKQLGCDGHGETSLTAPTRVGSFLIGKYEVTVEQYERFRRSTGRQVPEFRTGARLHGVTASQLAKRRWGEQLRHPSRPAVFISLEDAMAYCAWAGGHLPTERQWERAARGGDTRLHPGSPGAPDPPSGHSAGRRELEWINALQDVGSNPLDVSPFGVFDLAGNVSEWSADGFAPFLTSPVTLCRDAVLHRDSVAIRGASWRTARLLVETAVVARWFPEAGTSGQDDIGFRLVVDP